MPNFLTPGIRTSETHPFFEMDDTTLKRCVVICLILSHQLPLAIFGNPGQKQDGIDLFACRKDSDGTEVGQCECYEGLPPAKIMAASNEFFNYWDIISPPFTHEVAL